MSKKNQDLSLNKPITLGYALPTTVWKKSCKPEFFVAGLVNTSFADMFALFKPFSSQGNKDILKRRFTLFKV